MLTPAQQATLDYHLREANLLTNEELILELTDHYSTDLTERIAQGMTFETALTAIQTAFGGRKGLQKMERAYNRVTFRHYDESWKQALIIQFQKPLLWRQTIPSYAVLLVFSFFSIMTNSSASSKWDAFSNGTLGGVIVGFVINQLAILWPYLKSIVRNGIHNIPAEGLYMMKRQGLLTATLYTSGLLGYLWLLPLLPSSMQAVLVSIYLASVCLYMLTSHKMHELLYEYAPGR
ncbi:hypothetical protein [Spirosoma foliorum]|uniref:Uncharacterized protein n=1 Tax=Spirosoma foliorum TaxID=2710596 RepID=A0A7G5GVZ7_9BACT|nr:hypothetical protein [Spirosoma foliorum]QMW03039.1 hypothetical protein H3H32_35030 [Spirosoma foliorum]